MVALLPVILELIGIAQTTIIPIITTIALFLYPSFSALFRAFPAELFGCEANTTEVEFVREMRQYYSEDAEWKDGVLGIMIGRL